jgi:hypothetical protein
LPPDANHPLAGSVAAAVRKPGNPNLARLARSEAVSDHILQLVRDSK